MDRAYSQNPPLDVFPFHSLYSLLRKWGLAALVTVLLMFVMSQLIATDYDEPSLVGPPPVAAIHLPEMKPTVERYGPPEKVVAPEAQPLPPRTKTVLDPEPTQVVIAPPVASGREFDPAVTSRDPLPVYKPAPRYPAAALRRGLEGYVVIEFSIGKTGKVMNPVVVAGYDASGNPTEVFNRAALSAVARFKYQPQWVEGEAVIRHGVRNRIRFKLAE